MSSIPFAKGHGTENDFVLLPDVDGVRELSVDQIALVTDRRRGIGGDGVLRVVRSRHVADASTDAEWFMDYRNADGSIAEMCGNGVRVFARYLREEGLADGPAIDIGTRAGTKRALFEDDGSITVDMGPPQLLGESVTAVNGRKLTGLGVSMGNPHLAIDLAGSGLELDDLDLSDEPAYDRSFYPEGVNQEMYVDADPIDGADLHVRMRVHERGVGETRSCGTGICAVAVAALARQGVERGSVVVDVPGGRLFTQVGPERILLRGPAVIVARGAIEL
ncbi:diaminopimelate epimerase [Blastococcus sp. Marseille-P5729]|uniref:diaminopimelate epimerase n=1 Tax=Blastococcus sp. Marseille-P5729 TaxID=2086582 RepID=UPI0018FE63FD|nr:diaminopimelate epimerase [Blastococcus sp. Marseille-P5729]